MKNFILFIVALFMLTGISYATEECSKDCDKERSPVAERFEKVIIIPKGADVACPVTYQTMSCDNCHTRDWKLKEVDPKLQYAFPNINTWIDDGIGYFTMTGIISSLESGNFAEALDYYSRHNIHHVVFLINSPGGSLFDAWHIVGLIEEAKRNDITIETRCYSMAMSGAFMIFAAGSEGYRMSSPTAEFMWHELLTFEMFSIKTPSSNEDSARVLRHLQDTINTWLATRINVTKEEIDNNVARKEWWINGAQAKEIGLVDAFTNE